MRGNEIDYFSQGWNGSATDSAGLKVYDTYRSSRGDGHDTIIDLDATPRNTDTLQFGAGIAVADVSAAMVNDDRFKADLWASDAKGLISVRDDMRWARCAGWREVVYAFGNG